MFGLHFRSLLPAIIFSLCILEMSFGISVSFKVVWWFYFYFVWSIFNFNIKRKVDKDLTKRNMQLVIWYSLSCFIFTLQHFLGKEFYQQSTNEVFNILWWSMFGALLVYQMRQGQVYYDLFQLYVRNIVFFGCCFSALMGLLKYVNILSGRYLNSYYYENQLLSGSSLSPDYNLYSLGLTIGALLSIVLFKKNTKILFKFLYILTIGIIILSILLSGSRRGVLMSGFILFCLVYSSQILNARKQITLVTFLFLPMIVLFLISNNWGRISEYLLSTDLLDQGITRVLTLQEELLTENERISRFFWSLDYFSGRTSVEMIFGSGFEYLKMMGRSFSGELEDNPHNYLVSSLLYGGILSLVISLLMSYQLISSTFNHHRIWYPIVLVVLTFGLSSSNSMFAMRIFPTLIFIMSLRIHKSNNLMGLFINNNRQVTFNFRSFAKSF
jgi:hypothetical protein